MALASNGSFVAGQGLSLDTGDGLSAQFELNTTADLNVGDIAIICIAIDAVVGDTDNTSNSIFTTGEDIENNTWVKIIEFTANEWPGFSAAGANVAVYLSKITTQVLFPLPVAINIDGASHIGVACSMLGEIFTGAAGLSLIDSSLRAYHSFNNPAALSISNPGNFEVLYLRVDGIESQLQTISASSGFTKFGAVATNMIPVTYATGSDGTSLGCYAEFKIVTNAGASSDPGYSNYIIEHADLMLALKPNNNLPPSITPIGMKYGIVGTQISFTVTDIDVDAGDIFSINDVIDVVGASINSNSGEFIWTPTKSGSFTIRFRITDAEALTTFEDVLFKINALTISSIPTTGSPAHRGKVPSSVSAPSTPARRR